MKLTAVLLVLCMLTGCSSRNPDLDMATELRKQLINANQCEFNTTVFAYYSDEIYQFQMDCSVDNAGTLAFTVTAPESIAGITGQVGNDGAALTFDDEVLAFPVIADNRLSPVSAPWVFYNTLRCGYLSGSMETTDGALLSMDDSFQENPLHLEIQADTNCIPIHAQIYYQQNMVLSLEISDFSVA